MVEMKVTWHKMKDKLPPSDEVLYATVQRSRGRGVMEAMYSPKYHLWYDPDGHEFYHEDDSWYVVAWAYKPSDPEPYIGE